MVEGGFGGQLCPLMPPKQSVNCNCQSRVYCSSWRKMPMNYKITPQKFAVAVIQNVTIPSTPPYKQGLKGLCHMSRHFHEAQTSYLLSVKQNAPEESCITNHRIQLGILQNAAWVTQVAKYVDETLRSSIVNNK